MDTEELTLAQDFHVPAREIEDLVRSYSNGIDGVLVVGITREVERSGDINGWRLSDRSDPRYANHV